MLHKNSLCSAASVLLFVHKTRNISQQVTQCCKLQASFKYVIHILFPFLIFKFRLKHRTVSLPTVTCFVVFLFQPRKHENFISILRKQEVFLLNRILYWSISIITWMQPTPYYPCFFKSLLILSSQLCQGFSFQNCRTKIPYEVPFAPVPSTCPPHLILSGLINPVTYDIKQELLRFYLESFWIPQWFPPCQAIRSSTTWCS